MRISVFALSIGLLAPILLSAQSARPEDPYPYCLTPYRFVGRCDYGNCHGQYQSYTSGLPYQQVLLALDEGQSQYCCGGQLPVNTLYYCPGPVPLKPEAGSLGQLAQSFGFSRVFVRTC